MKSHWSQWSWAWLLWSQSIAFFFQKAKFEHDTFFQVQFLKKYSVCFLVQFYPMLPVIHTRWACSCAYILENNFSSCLDLLLSYPKGLAEMMLIMGFVKHTFIGNSELPKTHVRFYLIKLHGRHLIDAIIVQLSLLSALAQLSGFPVKEGN